MLGVTGRIDWPSVGHGWTVLNGDTYHSMYENKCGYVEDYFSIAFVP